VAAQTVRAADCINFLKMEVVIACIQSFVCKIREYILGVNLKRAKYFYYWAIQGAPCSKENAYLKEVENMKVH